LLSAAAFSLGHGGNDAQKTMGIITVLLYTTGHLKGEFEVPLWVVLASHAAIGLGTMTGGWRIVKTMGMKLTKLQPVGGFCAETAGAITLFATTFAGSRSRPRTPSREPSSAWARPAGSPRVKWGIAGRIVWAWILTMPMAALVAAICYFIAKLLIRY
jgi:PiT family inorganic phosphate transporter